MDDAPSPDAPSPDAPSPDAPSPDAPSPDAPVGRDAAVDASLCGPRAEAAPFELASDCRATGERIDLAALCLDPAVCPVTASVALRCGMTGGYGPWVVATRAGATVLYATNAGGFRNVLFNVSEAGAPEAPRLAPSAAVGRVAVDTSGRVVVIESENPGIATVHERDGGWRRGQAALAGADLLIGASAAFVDENSGLLGVYNVSGGAALATLRAGCWSSRALPGPSAALPAVGLDLNGRPWAAWWAPEAGGRIVLRLLDPDARTHDVGTAPVAAVAASASPALVADAADGRRAWPALADQRLDGHHVYTRGAVDSAWRDRVLAANPAAGTSDCPGESGPVGVEPCRGLTRCTAQTRGISRALGLARTADGTLWAAWATHDFEVDYALTTMGMSCGGGGGLLPPRCLCVRNETARRGGATVTLARVGDAAIVTTARFRVSAAAVVPELALAARGDVLHLVYPDGAAPGTSLRYLAVDTRAIR